MKTASWVIIRKATGEPVLETFSRRVADAINTDRYLVVPILDHLVNVNCQIKEEA